MGAEGVPRIGVVAQPALFEALVNVGASLEWVALAAEEPLAVQAIAQRVVWIVVGPAQPLDPILQQFADNLQTAHLPHLQLSAAGAEDDPSSLAEQLAARVSQLLDEREAEGEQTVQAWLDSQPIPPMRELVLSMLRDRLKDTMAQLEQAILSGERERIAGLTHQFRGWSGTYQMHDLYALIERMDCAIARPEESLAEVRSCWLEIRRLLERIPARYLKPEERTGSPAFP